MTRELVGVPEKYGISRYSLGLVAQTGQVSLLHDHQLAIVGLRVVVVIAINAIRVFIYEVFSFRF